MALGADEVVGVEHDFVKALIPVQITPCQRGQRGESKARRQVEFNLRPGIAELVDGGHQPLEATVALNRHVQAPGGAAHQASDIAFSRTQQWQHGVSQLQQAQPAAGEPHRRSGLTPD